MENLLFAAVSGSSLLSLLLWVIAVGLICAILWWLIAYMGLPAPFDKVARVLVALLAAVFLINAISKAFGHEGFIKW